MVRKIIPSFIVLFIAFVVFFTSVLRSASIKYDFTMPPEVDNFKSQDQVTIIYNLPNIGAVAPGHILWPLEAFRDKLWIAITSNSAKKAEILSLLADKRLVSAENFFKKGEADMGMEVLVKAEKYLEEAVKEAQTAKLEGMEVGHILERLTYSTMKHREVIENCLAMAPEDAKPLIIQTMEPSKRLYGVLASSLLETIGYAPENPFEN